MTPNVLCLVFGGQDSDRASWVRLLDSDPSILDWRSDMNSSFYLVSTRSADELARSLHESLKEKPRVRFLVVGLESNRQGWLPTRTWAFINQGSQYANYVAERHKDGHSDGVTTAEKADSTDGEFVIAKANPTRPEVSAPDERHAWTPVQEEAAYRQIMVDKLDWNNTTGSAHKWWEAFLKENQHRASLVLRLCEELATRGATIQEFFLAYVYSNVDNIQANLHYLDYSRLKKAETELKQKSKPQGEESQPGSTSEAPSAPQHP